MAAGDDQQDVGRRLETVEEALLDQTVRLHALEREAGFVAGTRAGDDGGIERLTRRSLLAGAGLAGLVGMGGGVATAAPTGQVGTSSRPVRAVYVQRLGGGLTGGTLVDDLVGPGLEIDGGTLSAAPAANDHVDVLDTEGTRIEDPAAIEFDAHLAVREREDGTVHVDSFDSTGANTHTDVSDDGTTAVANTGDIDFGTNLSVTDDGDGTATVDADVQAATNWTEADSDDLLETVSPFTGIDVTDVRVTNLLDAGGTRHLTLNGGGPLGLDLTLDTRGNGIQSPGGTALTLSTDGGTRALELGVPASDSFGDTAGGNVVAGHPNNAVNNNAAGVVVGGGGRELGGENTVGGDYATVGGGRSNTASDTRATVGGGTNNTASGSSATVGGGSNNTASGSDATSAGGGGNTASDTRATVGGGANNTASGSAATVPGGLDNTADGDYSFAAGRLADTNGNNGAFVWGDSSSTAVTAGAADEVRFQATGGFVIDNTQTVTISDRLPSGSADAVGIDGSGNLVNNGLSSARYKTNIEPLPTDTTAVLDLEPRAFEYDRTGEPGVGFIAEEVEETFPDLVVYDEEGRPDGVRYDRLGVYLLPEVRETRDRLAAAERASTEREARVDDLDAETEALDADVSTLREETHGLREANADLREEADRLREENASLRERLADLEAQVASIAAEAG